MFPWRDFCEVLLFSYLFFFQSKRRKDLEDVNSQWTKSIFTMPKTPVKSASSKDRFVVQAGEDENSIIKDNAVGTASELLMMQDLEKDGEEEIGKYPPI